MNYRHAFHAGNFADVVKHASLAHVLALMAAKDKPFVVLDSHAGLGLYDLASVEAFKTAEHRDGVARLWAARYASDRPKVLDAYLAALALANPARDDILFYPGSPEIARGRLRPQDKLILVEKHPEDAAHLARRYHGQSAVRVESADGWLAIKAKLPPNPRRGVILVDPPFEEPDEFDRMTKALGEGLKRFANGVYLLWYPIKDEAAVEAFVQNLRAIAPPKTFRAEVRIGPPGLGLHGTGLILVNPPWPIERDWPHALTWLAKLLAQGPGGGARFEALSADGTA